VAVPRLKTNLAILIAGDALGKLVNVFVFGRLGRILEPERYGRIEFMMAAFLVGSLVIDFGLGPWGARAVARAEEPASRILGRILALRSLLLVAALLLLGAMAAGLGSAEGWTRAILILSAGLMLLPKAAVCEFLFQGRNQMPLVAATTILEPLVALAGTVAFVRGPDDVGRVPFILAAAIAAVAAAQQGLARLLGVKPDLRHGFESAGRQFHESLPLGLSTLAWALRVYSPMIAVAVFVAGPAAGEFGAAHRLTVSMHAVVWLWFFNLLPTWSGVARQPGVLEALVKRSSLATVALAPLLVLCVWVLSPAVIRLLYGAGYEDSASLLNFTVLVPALAWVSGNFRFGLIARGALKAELAASSTGAAVAVVTLLLFHARLDPLMAAGIFCAAEAVTLLVAWAMWARKPAGPAIAPATAAR
jgi:O-antigen/teichoic acid export membrane protein